MMDFKYMILRATSALLLLSGTTLTGCEEEGKPDAFLSVTKQEIEVEYTGLTSDGEKANFDLGSNRSWETTYIEEWIELTHEEGERGRTRIFLTVEENNTGKDREGYVIFEGQGGTRRTIAVTQRLKVDMLSVSPAAITVVKSGLLSTGEKASIYVSTNCDWTISMGENSDWITPTAMSGKPGNVSIELNITQNSTGGVRTGTFTVSTDSDSKRATVTVTQNLEGLKVTTTSFSVNKFGFADENRTPLKFTVTAAEAWTSSGDGWLTLNPASGEAGATEVTLTVGENGTGASRSGEVRVTTADSGLEEIVKVSQTAKSSLYDDDGKPLGHQYYSEDFSWLSTFGGADCVGIANQSGAKAIYSTAGALDAFTNAGLADFNPTAKTIYACSDYVKMGATDKQSGIILPALALAPGQATNIELTFEACPNRGGSDGKGNVDAVTVTVEVLEGPGTVDGYTAKSSFPITPQQDWIWTPMSVKIYNATADTKIVIRSSQQQVTGLFRWYLDDIKMTKIAE